MFLQDITFSRMDGIDYVSYMNKAGGSTETELWDDCFSIWDQGLRRAGGRKIINDLLLAHQVRPRLIRIIRSEEREEGWVLTCYWYNSGVWSQISSKHRLYQHLLSRERLIKLKVTRCHNVSCSDVSRMSGSSQWLSSYSLIQHFLPSCYFGEFWLEDKFWKDFGGRQRNQRKEMLIKGSILPHNMVWKSSKQDGNSASNQISDKYTAADPT